MKKRGFTLIELLAVIVVLAVIALITTPTIMDAIKTARREAFLNSAYGIMEAIDDAHSYALLHHDNNIDVFYLYENGVETIYSANIKPDYKGQVPKSGGIYLHADGTINFAIYDGLFCAYKKRTEDKISISEITETACLDKIYFKAITRPFDTVISNGNFAVDSNNDGVADMYSPITITNTSISNRIQYFTATASNGGILYNAVIGNGIDKYYATASVKSTSDLVALKMQSPATYMYHSGSNKFERLSLISIADASANNFRLIDTRKDSFDQIEVKEMVVINLTRDFGLGNEPTLEQLDDIFDRVWVKEDTVREVKHFTIEGWLDF